MNSLLTQIDAIQPLTADGFALTPAGTRFFKGYLARHGIQLEQVTRYSELLEIVRQCNAADFAADVTQPAPASRLRLLWRGLRGLAKLH